MTSSLLFAISAASVADIGLFFFDMLPLRIEGKVQPAPQSDAEREAIERENAQRERKLKQERERSEIIRKAHDDFDAAQEFMFNALPLFFGQD